MDVGGLVDCLVGIYTGKVNDSILDKYSEIRRQKFTEVVDPISSSYIRLMYETEPEKVVEKSDILKLAKRTEIDRAFGKQLLSEINVLKLDFTQYYGNAAVESGKEHTTSTSLSPK